MKKLLLSLAAAVIGCSAVSAADLLYNLQFGSAVNVDNKYYANVNAYDKSFEYALTETEVFTVANFNNNDNKWSDMIKCGRKNNASTGMITSNFKVPAEVTSVVLGISKLNESGMVNSFTVETSSDNQTWTKVAEAVEAGYDAAAKTVTLDVASPKSGQYYRVSIDCAAAKANGVVWLTDVKYYGNWTATGDKKPAGISFPNNFYTVTEGTKFFNNAVLSNPNKLEVTYTSSNPEVAVYNTDRSVVEVLGLGTTVITATTAETDEFAAGEASYTLNVVVPANNVDQMLSIAKNKGDKVWVTGEMTVVYVNGQYVYVVDGDDQYTLLYGSNNYAVGDIIPAGWEAENALYNGLIEWKGNFPKATSRMPEAYLVYPTLTKVTNAEVNTVGWLNNVTLTAELPAKGQNGTAKLADGTEITIRNQFGIETQPAGAYDMKVAVAIYNTSLQLYPIELKAAAGPKIEPSFPAEINILCDNKNMTITQKVQGDGSYVITINGTSATDVKVSLETPEGWDYMLMASDDDLEFDPGLISPLRAAAHGWVPASRYAGYYQKANTITFETLKYSYTQTATVYLVWDDQVDANNPIFLEAKIKYDPNTGVEDIEAAEEAAEYYTLQGVKVENPANGIFVKVENGKATKVVL